MELDDKISAAQQLITKCISQHRAPVVMSSFGKDSMVMLELIKRLGLKLPIVFHREPFFPDKYEFSNKIIADNNYVVYDYPPILTAVQERNGFVEIMNFHQVRSQVVCLPTGIYAPAEGEPYLCGLVDLYEKPLGTFGFPWDVAFVAHKSSDVDPILGSIPLVVDVKHNPESCDYAFPLRWFTDQDVWACHELFGIPVNVKRYDPQQGYTERHDKTWNNDWFPACTLCLRKSSPSSVYCPKLGTEIENLSLRVRRSESMALPDYFHTDPATTQVLR